MGEAKILFKNNRVTKRERGGGGRKRDRYTYREHIYHTFTKKTDQREQRKMYFKILYIYKEVVLLQLLDFKTKAFLEAKAS